MLATGMYYRSGQSEVVDSLGVLEAAITADSKQFSDQFLRSISEVNLGMLGDLF
jgi:hypothetical protein